MGDSTQAVDSRTGVPRVIITALSEQPRPWCRLAAKIFRLKEGVINSEIKPKGDSHVLTVWRAEVNTRIHVRIQLQSKYVEYELRM